MIEYFFKNSNLSHWAKTFHVIRGRVVCIIVFVVSIWSDLLVFCWWFMSNIRNVFSLNSIGCVTKVRSCWHSGGKYNRQMYVRPTCSNLRLKDLSNIFNRWMKQAHGQTKWIKNNLLMILVDLIRVKNMLNSTISMSYPDVVIACIRRRCLWKHSEQLRQRWWSTIITMIIPWWLTLITITANHSNYLVCDRGNAPSLSLSGKW